MESFAIQCDVAFYFKADWISTLEYNYKLQTNDCHLPLISKFCCQLSCFVSNHYLFALFRLLYARGSPDYSSPLTIDYPFGKAEKKKSWPNLYATPKNMTQKDIQCFHFNINFIDSV